MSHAGDCRSTFPQGYYRKRRGKSAFENPIRRPAASVQSRRRPRGPNLLATADQRSAGHMLALDAFWLGCDGAVANAGLDAIYE